MEAMNLMTRGVITIEEGATVEEAMGKMLERRVTSLLVKGEDAKDMLWEDFGIITRKDIIYKVVAEGRDPRILRVEEIMAYPLIVIPYNMDVRSVAVLMKKTSVRRFPVVEKGEIIGLISNSDVLRAAMIEILDRKK